MEKYKISAVSYLNTKPFLWGLEYHEIANQISINLDPPAICADKLTSGVANIGLVPVAAIPDIPNVRIISDYCIGTKGTVRTVSLFSNVEIHKIKQIYLDYQSKTSVQLLKLLLKEYWNLSVEFLDSFPGYEKRIQGETAALIIGDRAINAHNEHAFQYDLGSYWFEMTGLPFVFATWVANCDLPKEFVSSFNEALALGVNNIPKISKIFCNRYPSFDLENYLTNHIDFNFDESKKEALKLFIDKIPLPNKKELIFG